MNDKLNTTYKIAVSIIVPCYNTAPWLDECLQSLVDQTLEQIEIICVNDGSTDGTGTKLDLWQNKYPNKIKVIHQANGGPSNARNAGMAIAQGECIGFVDSDDFVDICMYEKLYTILNNNNAEIVRCDCFFIDKINLSKNNIKINYIAIKKNYTDILIDDPVAWLGLYKTSFLKKNKIIFVPELFYEDVAFQYEVAIYKPIFYKTQEKLYYCRENRKGRISLFTGIECFDIFSVFSYIDKILLQHKKNNMINKFLLKKKISLFFYYLRIIEKQYKKKFLSQAANELFSNHRLLDIYKNLFTGKYEKKRNYLLAPVFVILLNVCYVLTKLPFVKSTIK